MKNTITETTRLLLQGNLTKEEADKILLDLHNVMPCFEFSSKATKYKENADNDIIAVDTDGISLQNDNLPHKAYTLEEGAIYTVKLYKA
jgi:hypothetical protein